MIKAYVNSVVPVVEVHRNPNCRHAQAGAGDKTRHVLVNPDFISRELVRFRDNRHRFSAEPGLGDMWLLLDFQDTEFETALARYLKGIIGMHCDPVGGCELKLHC